MEVRKVRQLSLFSYIILQLSLVCHTNGADGSKSLPEEYLPQIQFLEIISSPLNRSLSVNLWKDRNTDIVIGEDTSATSRILMKCNASYPVQWVYLGDGKPEFTTFTNVKWQEDPKIPLSFEAEASLGLLGFHGVLREEDTGNYTCRSIQEPAVHSYYYVYVPGDELFVSPNGTNITYTPQDQYIRIPCGVSHPKITATLCKRGKNDELTCPVNGASAFNSKGGFLLNLKKQSNPAGTYVCTATYKLTHRIVEHHVMREGDRKPPTTASPKPTPPKPGKDLCDPSPCGKQAECSIVDGRAVCYCFRGLNGDPYDECAPGKCRSNGDCPRGKFCRQGVCTTDPCNPSPCGKGGECSVVQGRSKCSCQKGFTGLPPNCVVSCAQNFDCAENEACIKGICQSPCPGPCGQNAECRVLANGAKRTAQCSCPTGFIGDPLQTCYEFGANGTTPGPWNKCPPGYVGQPPACSRKECDSDIDCPFGQKCAGNLCDKGFIPSCAGKCGRNAECKLSPTTSDPICVCPSGTTGNPTVHCKSERDPPTWGDPCTPNPCQYPAECHVVQGSRACVCPAGFSGDPSNCVPSTTLYPSPRTTPERIFCKYDAECRTGEMCAEGRCQETCNGLCGYGAVCESSFPRKYRSIYSSNLLRSQDSRCVCPSGHEGNPYVSCIPIRTGPPPQGPPSSTHPSPDPCFPSPCATFAECSVQNNAPLCRCLDGYHGNPFSECRQAPSHYPPSNEPPMPPPGRPTPDRGPPMPPPGRPTPDRGPPPPQGDLDFQGHSWGHHPGLDTGRPSMDRDFGPSGEDGHGRNPPYSHPPPTNYYDRNDRDFHAGQMPPLHPTSNNHVNYDPYETPTPKTLGPPMPPLTPMVPVPEDRDECSFRNPYADYDMESCGVGRRCERDFRGVKRCVCISPFDCIGPTSKYRGSCQTSRDCLLSDQICINGTCGNPCSPQHSPCAGVAFAECRVIEGNVLCTCRRGYVGNPASGLDCRPKRSPLSSPGSPPKASIVSLDKQHYQTPLVFNGSHSIFSADNKDNSISVDDEEGEVIVGAGSSAPGNNHQRRHYPSSGLKDVAEGQCGFGSGNQCDEKSHCKVIGGNPICVCKSGYHGEFPNCKPECEKNEDCSESMACQYHQCMDPCLEESLYCAANASCKVSNHTAGCECEPGFQGIPWIQCKTITDLAKDDCMGFNCKKRNVQT